MNIEPYTIPYTSGDDVRNIWLLSPPAAAETKLCVFLDAEFYMDRLGAPRIVTEMMTKGEITPMTCVFVSQASAEARHHDYTCNDDYSEFIVRNVIETVRERVPTMSADGHIVCGLSLSGLASAYLAATHPGIFSAAICQSPSFWWNNEAFSRCTAKTCTNTSTYWISVGNKETETAISHPPTGLRQDISQIAACARAAGVLLAHGNLVHYTVFEGGHDFGSWKAELPAALQWVTNSAAPQRR